MKCVSINFSSSWVLLLPFWIVGIIGFSGERICFSSDYIYWILLSDSLWYLSWLRGIGPCWAPMFAFGPLCQTITHWYCFWGLLRRHTALCVLGSISLWASSCFTTLWKQWTAIRRCCWAFRVSTCCVLHHYRKELPTERQRRFRTRPHPLLLWTEPVNQMFLFLLFFSSHSGKNGSPPFELIRNTSDALNLAPGQRDLVSHLTPSC